MEGSRIPTVDRLLNVKKGSGTQANLWGKIKKFLQKKVELKNTKTLLVEQKNNFTFDSDWPPATYKQASLGDGCRLCACVKDSCSTPKHCCDPGFEYFKYWFHRLLGSQTRILSEYDPCMHACFFYHTTSRLNLDLSSCTNHAEQRVCIPIFKTSIQILKTLGLQDAQSCC